MDEPREQYAVGFGKPPVEGRFKKGTSGNPKGRRKGSQNALSMYREIAYELVNVSENGQTKTMTRIKAALYRLMSKALLGDLRAMRAILELQRLVDAADALQERSDQPSERGRIL